MQNAVLHVILLVQYTINRITWYSKGLEVALDAISNGAVPLEGIHRKTAPHIPAGWQKALMLIRIMCQTNVTNHEIDTGG